MKIRFAMEALQRLGKAYQDNAVLQDALETLGFATASAAGQALFSDMTPEEIAISTLLGGGAAFAARPIAANLGGRIGQSLDRRYPGALRGVPNFLQVAYPGSGPQVRELQRQVRQATEPAEKQVAKAVRYVAKSIAMEESYKNNPVPEDLVEMLGPKKVHRDLYENNHVAGVVTGLAWTSVGGDILFIESAISEGKSQLSITGNLGKVMKESATIAMEFIKSNKSILGLENFAFDRYNVHIHVPEGATPKDGPSAGITMLTSLVSLFTQRRVKSKLAMTG